MTPNYKIIWEMAMEADELIKFYQEGQGDHRGPLSCTLASAEEEGWVPWSPPGRLTVNGISAVIRHD